MLDAVLDARSDARIREAAHLAFARTVLRFPDQEAGELLNPNLIGYGLVRAVAEEELGSPQWDLWRLRHEGDDQRTFMELLNQELITELGLLRDIVSGKPRTLKVDGEFFSIATRIPTVIDIGDAAGWRRVREAFVRRLGLGIWPGFTTKRNTTAAHMNKLGLQHVWTDAELDSEELSATLQQLHRLWKPGIVLRTREFDAISGKTFICDASGKVTEEKAGGAKTQLGLPMGP
jgi:hypothetical protein